MAILEAVVAVLGARGTAQSAQRIGHGAQRAAHEVWGAYAEGGDAQDAVDRVTDTAIAAAPGLVEPWVTALRTLVDGASSLEAIRDALPGLYATASHRALGEHLGEALAAAEAIGRESVQALARRAQGTGHRVGAGRGADRQASGGAAFLDVKVPRKGTPYTGATEMWRAIGRTYAGNLQADMQAAVYGQVERALTEGTTLRDFTRELQARAEEQRVWDLSPARIETIYRTSTQRAFQAARYRELTDPGVQALLPYWRYVAVLDNRVRPEHAAMHGKVYRADDPIWQEWYPPNGFNCRCTVEPLTEQELRARGLKVETDPPDTTPDPDFSGRGGDLPTEIARVATRRSGSLWDDRPGQPLPGADGDTRLAFEQIPLSERRRNLDLVQTVDDRVGAGASYAQAIRDMEAEAKEILGISPNEAVGVLLAPDGHAVQVSMESLAYLMKNRRDPRERWLRYLRDAVEHPYEVLRVAQQPTDPKMRREFTGEKWRRKYVGLYEGDGGGRGMLVTAEEQPDGLVVWNAFPARARSVDGERRAQRVEWQRPT